MLNFFQPSCNLWALSCLLRPAFFIHDFLQPFSNLTFIKFLICPKLIPYGHGPLILSEYFVDFKI